MQRIVEARKREKGQNRPSRRRVEFEDTPLAGQKSGGFPLDFFVPARHDGILMATAIATYKGGLRVECTHVQSGTTILTDAPTDNPGSGEEFSPTDLCATAVAACGATIMGIYAEREGVDISGMRMEITKKMNAEPRRIGEIDVVFHMPARSYTDKQKTILERSAHACPVFVSLHPDVAKNLTFVWAD